MRDQASKWDVVVAASWLPSSRRQSLVQLFDPLKAAVGASGLMMVSRMLVLEPCNHFVVAVRAAAGQVEHGFQKIDGGDYGAVRIVCRLRYHKRTRSPSPAVANCNLAKSAASE